MSDQPKAASPIVPEPLELALLAALRKARQEGQRIVLVHLDEEPAIRWVSRRHPLHVEGEGISL